MTRRLWLHIGMAKTGTSSIQETLQGYDDGKVAYCGFNTANHGYPVITLFKKDSSGYRVNRNLGRDAAEIARQRQVFDAELRRECEERTSDTIISGEAICNGLDRDEIAAMLDRLRPHYGEIRILAYVRPFLSFTKSSLQQRIKGGRAQDVTMGVPQYRNRFFGQWVDLLGKDAIEFVKFDRASLYNGDVVEDFCHRTGVDLARCKRVQTNESLPVEGMAALYAYNTFYPRPSGGKAQNRAYHDLIAALAQIGSSKLALTQELVDKLYAQEADDIAWMEEVAGFSLRDEERGGPGQHRIGSGRDLLALAGTQVAALQALAPEAPLRGKKPARQAANLLNAFLAARGAGQKPRRRQAAAAAAAPEARAAGRTCYLHIGFHKTGTSAIQDALFGYEDEQTVYAPLPQPNHSIPLSLMFMQNPHQLHVFKKQGQDRKAVARRRKAALQQFGTVLASTGKDVILSGEGLSLNLNEKAVSGFLGFLRREFASLKVIAYVRPVEPYLVSMFQQTVKLDGRSSLELKIPDYAKRLQPWIDGVGAENVTAVKYDRKSLAGGDIVTDFCTRLGLDRSRAAASSANTGLSAEAVALLFCHNRLNGRLMGSPRADRAHNRLVERLEGFGSHRFSFAPELTAPLLAGHGSRISQAEALCGFSLQDSTRRPGDVLFASEQDILDYAGAQETALRQFLPELAGQPAAAEHGPAERCAALLQALQAQILEQPRERA